ncbi:MAG: type II secretion system protein GspG [Acidobacteria bacterium]|nr:type II secretion system protein GspG [Acidobacteriota bacterium]
MDVNDVVPPAHSPAAGATPGTDRLTQDMLDSLRSTRPWVRFLSIIGFIAVGFMILGSIFIIGVGVIGGGDEEMPGFLMIGLGLLYLLMAILYVFPSMYLFRYASSITRALQPGPKAIPVQDALRHQKSFWKFVGILTLASMLLYIPGVLAAIAIPNFLTATQRAKQKRTMADLRTLATALEAYAVDHNRYPEGPLEALPSLLQPTYIRTMPRTDGWNNPFVYTGRDCSDGGCQRYVIASGGKDGQIELDLTGDLRSIGPTTNFNNDIAFADGHFIAWPDGSN